MGGFRADLQAHWRRVAEALIGPDEARRARTFDRITGGGEKVILAQTTGQIPTQGLGNVPDEHVAVALAEAPSVTTQEQFNAFILAALGGASFDVDTILTNADGAVLVNSAGNVLVGGS